MLFDEQQPLVNSCASHCCLVRGQQPLDLVLPQLLHQILEMFAAELRPDCVPLKVAFHQLLETLNVKGTLPKQEEKVMIVDCHERRQL